MILTEAFSPGACVAEVARRHDVSTGLVYTWRRKWLEAAVEPDALPPHDQGFAEATIDDVGGGGQEHRPTMVIDLARGKRVSIFALASPAQVAAALKALR